MSAGIPWETSAADLVSIVPAGGRRLDLWQERTSHAALFSNGVATDLGNGGLFSRANGINTSGQVVGFSSDTRDGNNSRAFILSTANRSRMIDLGTLGGVRAGFGDQ